MQAQQVEVRAESQPKVERKRQRLDKAEYQRRFRARKSAGMPSIKGWRADVQWLLSTESGQREFLRAVGAA